MLLIRKTLWVILQNDTELQSEVIIAARYSEELEEQVWSAGVDTITTFTHELWLSRELVKYLYLSISILGSIVYCIYQKLLF